jgi:hypothetical protein
LNFLLKDMEFTTNQKFLITLARLFSQSYLTMQKGCEVSYSPLTKP